MKSLKKRKANVLWKSVIIPLVVFSGMIFLLIFSVSQFEKINCEENRILTEQAIQKTVIQCYANEGRYPSSITYLKDNYYLTVDEEKYYVFYDCWASNVMPEIAVIER